ncbi:MAG: sensor histidine kinase [Planctomycetota bacterium]|jgi:signal transduction histidine kinase
MTLAGGSSRVHGPSGRRDLGPQHELRLLRLLRDLNSRRKQGWDAARALRYGLRKSLEFFEATEGCVAVLTPGSRVAEPLLTVPQRRPWDLARLTRFIRGEDVEVPRHLLLARLRRHERRWGVLGIRLDRVEFEWHARRAATMIASAINEHLEHIDRERLRDIQARIDRKILEQRRPKALFYEVLHGLRSLTEYDHSASLLIFDDEANRLEVVAEQIAWRKAKSQRVGLKLPLTDELRQLLGASTVYGFDRRNRAWREWKNRPAAALARLLDYNRSDARCREGSMLCAPLVTRDSVLGLLKVAAKGPGTFGPHEAKLVSRFLSQAAVALQNLQRTETLQLKMIEAERKHAMADLARGVSHDVNNALGSILPLVQQMRADLSSGHADADVTAEDLKEIERSVQLCRRIFGGMLSFARGAARAGGEAQVQPAVECTVGILKDGMARRGIEIDVNVSPDVPPVNGAQSDLEQVLLNLVANARDAMPAGGLLAVSARETGGVINLVVEDTGCGIPRDQIAKIQEPFFTTKPSGTGLGLAICRSLIWQMGGKLEIKSAPANGTRITVALPARRLRGGGR